MQIYKTFIKIALRSLSYGFIYIGVFIGVSISIASTQSKESDTSAFSSYKVDISVIDRDNSSLSRELYDYLDKTHDIKSIKDSKDSWLDEIYARTVEYVLIIEEGFEEQTLNKSSENFLTSYSAPDSNRAYIVSSQIESWMQNMRAYLDAGLDAKDASAKALAITEILPEVSRLNGDSPAEATTLDIFFQFIPYILLCILINSLGPVLIIWNRSEIRSRTAVSGLSGRSQNWGTIGAVATYSVIVAAILVAVIAVFYRKDFLSASTPYHLLNTLCFLAVSISVTFLVAQLSKKVQTLSIWSNILGLSTSFLGGVFVSRSLLPNAVVSFSKCLPTYWYINILEELKSFSGHLSPLAKQSLIIQLLFSAAFVAIAFAIIRFRRQKNS
ncbi:MAG: ABC transporter permease [Butyrivibrio sp.]|nr:ABC transporter permease [Butyrivibrio sp.]